MKRLLIPLFALLLVGCTNNENKTNWDDKEIASMNETFQMPIDGDKNLYTIPFMFIDNNYMLITIKETFMVNYLVINSNIEDVEKYYSIALENDFEISYKEENKIAIKELPIGKIELSVSYGETPYTNSYAFYAQAKLIKSV